MGFVWLDEKVCLNHNYQKIDCRSCRDACPNHCWDSDGTVRPERCDGCGLCLAACPADAVGVEGIAAADWRELVAASPSACSFACRKHGAGSWSCLGFLTARDLIALTVSGCAVTVHDGSCRGCRVAVAEHLEREVAAANEFLGEIGKGPVRRWSGGDAPPSVAAKVDRRAFFTALFSTGVQTARNIIDPTAAALPLRRNRWRAKALGQLAAGPQPQTVFPTFAVSDACSTCGLCAQLCPAKAFQATLRDAVMELAHDPLLCTGCGLCVEHCPESALTRLPAGPAQSGAIGGRPLPRCNECGAPFQPAGRQLTCFDCLVKGQRSIFEP